MAVTVTASQAVELEYGAPAYAFTTNPVALYRISEIESALSVILHSAITADQVAETEDVLTLRARYTLHLAGINEKETVYPGEGRNVGNIAQVVEVESVYEAACVFQWQIDPVGICCGGNC